MLLDFLKHNENTRKIFGKRELKIIEKQLKGVSLTQSEKNRLSRDIRKKFEFIRNVNQFSQEFNLKKGDLNKNIIDGVVEEISNDKLRQNIKRIFLFGSSVENKLGLGSDINIAVEFRDITKKQAFEFRARISGRVSERVDIQVFNILPEKIKKEILNKHKILYNNG